MYQTSEPDLDDTLATLDAAIEEFHQIRDGLQLSTAGAARESAEQEKTAASSLVSTLG